MNLILFDDKPIRGNLLPFTATRPIADIRFGILTIREKWEKRLGLKSSSATEDYLQASFPMKQQTGQDTVWINGSISPTADLIEAIQKLAAGKSLCKGEQLIAFNSGKLPFAGPAKDKSTWSKSSARTETALPFLQLKNNWDIFKLNAEAIREDYDFLTKGRTSAALSKTNQVLGTEVFLESGAKVECSILNSSTGPIYIGAEAEVMEGSMIRGPFALCAHSTLKLGSKIYGATTVGPYSKAGGEISNSVIFGYSNKGHDGFLGNSVLGEWCNLGADTNNSNLKNNYGEVKLYNYPLKGMTGTGLQFCGLMMGDHSKTGINTMLNTGTVVGVCANIFGAGFPPVFVPDFSWGGGTSFQTYEPKKAQEVAARVFERRDLVFGDKEKNIFQHIFDQTRDLRKKGHS